MLNMDAVFQLPMFWLNADAARNACRADPTPSTAQRTKAQRTIYRVAEYKNTTSDASSHSLVATSHRV